MSFTLRPYQQEFYEQLRHALAKYKRVIACAATGSGKTKVFITIARAALSKGKTVLILTESSKIFDQLNREIPETVNISPSSKLTYINPAHLHLAMAQTLARRGGLVEQLAALGSSLLIINDEAHIGTATKLLLQFPNALLIGFTATPAMKWAKHLPILYNGIVVGKQPEWLVEHCFLTPYKHAQVTAANLDSLQVRNGEYTEESQERIFDTPNAHKFIIEHLRSHRYTKCMIFCASIRSAESLHASLTGAGFAVATQHSNYEKRSESEQSYALGQFMTLGSGTDICISIASMNKGFDFPPVDLILLNRATTSLPLYLQMCGRASRLSPATNKTEWLVLDYGGNGKRHNRWDFNHDWDNLWNKIPKKREGLAPVKDCPKCKYLLPAIVMKCPNCGHEFVKSSTPDPVDAVRIVMLEKAALLNGKRLSQLTPIELAQWAQLTKKRPHAIRVAKAQEQQHIGWLEQFGKAMGYKRGWYEFQLSELPQERIDFFDAVVKIQ